MNCVDNDIWHWWSDLGTNKGGWTTYQCRRCKKKVKSRNGKPTDTFNGDVFYGKTKKRT